MLKINIIRPEQYDEINNVFIESVEKTILLEHSLVSLSKWESRWNKPFISKIEKTTEETIDYIFCMTIEPNIDIDMYKYISNSDICVVRDYIGANMTATTFSNQNKENNREIVTSEIIYYWMTALNIPFECQTWHLNRLLTLINVCNLKNNPPKKMSRRETLQRNAALNASRKKK